MFKSFFSVFVAVLNLHVVIGCATKGGTTPAPTAALNRSAEDIKSILVIGHRGASGYRPEHTLASYELAIEQGADFIEPDLVMTKDGVLIARHEVEIGETTDAAIKFPKRKKTKVVDGKSISGWFAEDFTLKEIKTLRAKERLSTRNQSYNGKFEIPTFAEVLELAQKRGKELGRVIGVYPETKHPSYLAKQGKNLEPALAAQLKKAGWDKATDPVIIQSFELDSLEKMRALVGCRLVFLFSDPREIPPDLLARGEKKTYGDYLRPDALKELSAIVYGIGVSKQGIIRDGQPLDTKTAAILIGGAHQAGLKVHVYTFRSDAPFLSANYQGNPTNEYREFFALGIDGVFTDFPDDAVKAKATLTP